MLNPSLQLHLTPTADPNLIVTNTIISYSTLELEQAISRELDENPALELTEYGNCSLCGGPLSGTTCTLCASLLPSGPVAFHAEVPNFDAFPGIAGKYGEDELDAFSVLAAPRTLADCLLEQLRLVLNEREQEVALYLVGNLDERGYVTASPAEIAQTLRVEESLVQLVLRELQELDPPGIGARTVKECLMLQLRWLRRQGVPIPVTVRAIVRDHLEALGHQRLEYIRRALGISRQEVKEAFLFIRAHLHPYPANHYYGQSNDLQSVPLFMKPSILISRRTTEPHSYDVEVAESYRHLVRINPLYQQLRQHPAVSAREREHVVVLLDRASLFVRALQRRYHLLQQLATYLVAAQRDFLDHGSHHLHPLTQTYAAKELGVHPSTVSRAAAGKFAQLPSHALLPLQSFFAPETRAQDIIRQMILQETSPLSDEQLARRLRDERGILISRQMVANYRANLKIPAARQRALLQQRKGCAQ